MGKRKRYVPKPYESIGVLSDTSTNIYKSMLESDAWNDLTIRQRILYVYCKSLRYGQKTNEKKKLFEQYDYLETPSDVDEYFSLTTWYVTEKFKLYSQTNLELFYRDRDALIEHGLIKCVADGSHNKRKNIYTYSSKWQVWGTSEFEIEFNEMTSRLIRIKKATIAN